MSFSPLSLSRRRVLGELYAKCLPVTEQVQVFLIGDENQLLGFADESLGNYADALTFHLADDVCKRLSAGHYTYEFDLEHSDQQGRLILKAIFLKAPKVYRRPVQASSSE